MPTYLILKFYVIGNTHIFFFWPYDKMYILSCDFIIINSIQYGNLKNETQEDQRPHHLPEQ